MFENREPISYCKLKDGQVEVYKGKDDNDQKIIEKYDRIVAKIVDIRDKEFEFKGEKMKAWELELIDTNGDKAILSLGYSSGFTRSFFNALATGDFTRDFTISCYVKVSEGTEYNTPSLWQGPNMLSWKYQEMPKAKRITVGSKEVLDDTEAVAWTVKLVEEIKKSLVKLVKEEIEEPKTNSEEELEELMTTELPDDLPWEEQPKS